MTITNQQIVDNGDLRKYRTELPNLYDDLGLDPYEYRLLGHYKRVCGANGGSCFEGTRKTADNCKMSVGKVSEARASLVERELISVEKFGQRLVVTIADVWAENFRRYAGGKDNQDGGDTQEEGEREEIESGEEPTNPKGDAGDEGVRSETEGETEKELTAQQKMFGAICHVCKLDPEVISEKDKARVGRVAGKLLKSSQGYTPENVLYFYGSGNWWYKHDWRGKQGDIPTPEKIQETILSAKRYHDGRRSRSSKASVEGGMFTPLG